MCWTLWYIESMCVMVMCCSKERRVTSRMEQDRRSEAGEVRGKDDGSVGGPEVRQLSTDCCSSKLQQ